MDGIKFFYGKEVEFASFDDQEIILVFGDGWRLSLVDDPQCCERRYFTTDDNLEEIIGQKVLYIKQDNVQVHEDGYDVHEISFLTIQTTKQSFGFVMHNVHNGYYGGFSLRETYFNVLGRRKRNVCDF